MKRVSRAALAPFAAFSASYFAHIGFFNPYLSLWLKDLGISIGVIGLLLSLQSVTRIYSPYLWGWLSDRTGQRVRLLKISAGIALLCSFGLGLDTSTAGLGLVLFLMFSHTSSMMPMGEAALAHLVSSDGQFNAKRYGRIRLWGSIGFLVTVFIAGYWFENHGMTDFPVCTWLSLLMVNLSVWYLPNQQEEHNHHEPQPALWPTLRQPRHVWFFCTMFFHVLSHIGMYAFFSLYLDSLGYSKFMIGLFWAVSVVVEIIGFYTQSRWMHHLSLSGWVLFCSSIMVLRMYITAWWADYLIGLVLAQMLHAITFAIHHTVCIAWINTYFPPRLRGRGQALYSVIGYGLTGVLGTLAGAALSEHFGLQSIYIGSMCAALAAALAASGLLIKGRADEKQ